MATVTFRRSDNISEVSILDGQIVFDTSNHKIYMDNGTERLQYGGGTELLTSSEVAQATNSNAFSATGSLNLFLQKTTVVNSKSDALSVTQNNIPLGCLAFKEMLGTTDYSGVGDGTVSGGLTALKGEILQQTLAVGATTLIFTSTTLESTSFVDVYTDTYGVNPTDITVDNVNKQITLTFDEQEASVVTKVIIRNI